MDPNILISIQITLVGMTLVFLALILLWWLMELLVRLTALRAPKTADAPAAAGGQPASLAPETGAAAGDASAESARRQQAAAIAVALALAEKDHQAREFPIPPTAIVSAWQAVNRANMLNRRGLVR